MTTVAAVSMDKPNGRIANGKTTNATAVTSSGCNFELESAGCFMFRISRCAHRAARAAEKEEQGTYTQTRALPPLAVKNEYSSRAPRQQVPQKPPPPKTPRPRR